MKNVPFWDDEHDLPIDSSTDEQLVAMLDVLVKAGWVKGYKIFPDYHTIDFTDAGLKRIERLSQFLDELGLPNVSPEIWWALRNLAF